MNRRTFIGLAAAALTGGRSLAADALQNLEPVRLKAWEVIGSENSSKKGKRMIRITARNGAVGYVHCTATGLEAAAHAAGDANLLDHEGLLEKLVAASVSRRELAALDIAAWDLHARLLGKPLHALLGTKRSKVFRYGDVRGQQPGFSPQQYAETVARYLEHSGLQATKLHFPGSMGDARYSISFSMVIETLKAVRKMTGKEIMLAWDPYLGSAESATSSMDEAKQILQLMDDLDYAWIEGPLPPTPYESQIPKYAELVKTGTKQRIQAEGPDSPIGDGTSFQDMKRWAQAGAITQCSSDATSTGVTNCLRMLDYAKAHQPLAINLHWASAPHAHLAMAYDEKVFPIVEFPMNEDVPKEFLSGPWLLAPDWPGIYRLET